ncbi:protein bark beetle-like [Amphiura filiformis]|uniref:protein bark beetle-like n=1 Tax=Amphiura filiformis TaxID=82378 RepID=UPI003B22565E
MVLKRSSTALFSALIFILLFHSGYSQSEIGGNITQDATLDISGSPYNVTSTLVISPDVTLTVDPGVDLQFQHNTGVIVRGSLIANGTETERIKFTRIPVNISIPIGYDQIRLADGFYANEGRLEVFLNGQWGTVCEHNWGPPDTQVACRQLGYLSGYVSRYSWYGSGPIWLDDVECIGDEEVLWNCSHNGIGVHNCGHHNDFGLLCETSLIEQTLWGGLQWIQEGNSTSKSVLSYTDIEYVGKGLPAISAAGIPPILNNVNIINNFGDGVKFSKVSVETMVFNSRILQNEGNGLDVSTVGTGSIYVEGGEIATNGEYGVQYDGNALLEDPDYYRFCGDNRRLSEYIYLEHAKDDYIDPLECLQVFSTPPGTTITAFILSGAGSPYTGIKFWNGNTTDDLLLSSSISPNSDYDLHLQNVYIHDNYGGINVQHTHQRLTVEASTITGNIYYGMRVTKTYGYLSLLNADVSHNKGWGLLIDSASGTTSVDKCIMSNNTDNAISIRFASSSNKAYELSITNSTFEFNEEIAISVEPVNCNDHICNFVMSSCYVHDHADGGLEFYVACNNFIDISPSTAVISNNTFTKNGNMEFLSYITVIGVYYVPFVTMDGNRVANNTGSTIMEIVFPATDITQTALITIQDNTIVDNFADNIVHIIGSPYSDGLDKGIFKDNVVANNTAFIIMEFIPTQWTEIVISDTTIDCNYFTCMYFRHQFEGLYLSNTHFFNGRYLIDGSAPLVGKISKCSFYDMDNGLQLGASNMILEDTSFSFIKTEAVLIGGSNWIVKNCTFDNTPFGIKITSRCNTTIDGCNFFQTSQSAIYFEAANIVNAFISDSIFKNNYGTVVDIEKASDDASLSVINNVFEANEATVLKIPNELPRCDVRNNNFLQNSALHIVEFFEAVTLSSAMSSNFEHIFNGNVLIDNHPSESSNSEDQACTIITRLLAGKFQYNFFGNEDFMYELCLGAFIFFDADASLDATFNNWNTTDASKIDQKIFDLNDWNDRPGVTFRPYLTDDNTTKSQNTRREQLSFGGKLLKDKTLTLSGSPYLVQSDITIPDNVTLTIEPGVELLFEPNIGILVLGSLVARGNDSFPIVMNTLEKAGMNTDWGAVRLKDGPSSRAGRLEIFVNAEWGTVCDDSWSPNNAKVVCGQLGMGAPISYLNRDFTGTPPDRIWLDDVRCFGDELMLADCPSNGIGVENCGHSEDVGLECEYEPINSWGGIRIIGNQESNTSESILEYVDILNTGSLHLKPAPGLYIRHASPRLDNINIMYSSSSGILTDTPVIDFILHDVTVLNAVNGVVLYKTANVILDMDKINIRENEESAVVLHEEDDGFAFSMCYINTIPICAPYSDSVIEVDKYADLLLQIPYKMYTDSSHESCIVYIRPKRNEILVLQVYKADKDDNDVSVYEGETANLLGNISHDEQHLTVVSPEAGGVLRVYTSYSPNLNLEVYTRVTTTDDVRMMKHSIRDSIFADNNNGGIKVTTIPSGLQNSVSNMLPYDYHIYLDRCQMISNEASTSEYVLSMILQSGSVFEMENCKISENERMGVLKLQLGDGQYRNKSMHRILNNEFSYNSFLKGMVFIEGLGSNPVEWVHIYGNLLLSNQCYESESVIDINNVYINMDSNIAVNNAAYHVLHINQDDIPDEPQQCTNNLITNNVMQVINKLYTIEVGATGVEFYSNILDNPINDYEISVTLGDGIINATHNWWGTTSSELIAERLRDSDTLIGIPDVPDVVFEPFLLSSPSHVQSEFCPIGYIEYEGDCFGYKGGAVDFDAAEQSCKIDGAILPTMPSAILQTILQDRTQHSSSPNGIWLDYLSGNKSVDKDAVSWERSCFIMELSESPNDNGMNETSCSDNQPYICTQSALPKPTTEGKTTTSPVTEPTAKTTTAESTEPMSTTAKTTQPQSTTAESTEPKSTTARPTQPKSTTIERTQSTQPRSTSVTPTESKVCTDDDDCNGHGICEAGQCICSSCIYTGKNCETDWC